MFQTELIKFLQSFATDWLTDLMLSVTRLGYSSFYIPMLVLITFGISFRKGFLLTHLMLWVGLLTDLLKNIFALPRPADVDSGIKLLEEGVPNPAPFVGKGGAGFWELPAREAIHLYRSQPEWSFGFPSGHVSGTTTFWGGLSLLFRYRIMRIVAIIVIILMSVSRMYLGRHFLADVLAGFLLAAIFLVIGHRLYIRKGSPGRLLDLRYVCLSMNWKSILFVTYMLLLPFALLLLSPYVEFKDAGRLLGLNAGFTLLGLQGLPNDSGGVLRRAGRVLVAFALYLIVNLLVGRGIEMIGLNEDGMWTEFFAASVPVFAVFWGGVILNRAIGLYTMAKEIKTDDA